MATCAEYLNGLMYLKDKHKTKEDAENRISMLKRIGIKTKQEQFTYLCKICKKWHTGSLEEKNLFE